jgi:hypothetical protein
MATSTPPLKFLPASSSNGGSICYYLFTKMEFYHVKLIYVLIKKQLVYVNFFLKKNMQKLAIQVVITYKSPRALG